MNKFCIISNNTKENITKVRKSIVEYLEENGKTVTIANVSINANEECFTDVRSIPGDTDCIIVLGGDGTFLRAASDLKDVPMPLFGINMGTLGFLAETEQNGYKLAFRQLINNEYAIESRMMIDINAFETFYNDGIADNRKINETDCICALNDIVVARSGFSRLISMRVYINGKFVNEYRADGLIISTPTGSTGYNLSAGGPVVIPKSELMIITPICPHSLNARSIVVSSEDVIKISISPGKKTQVEEAIITVDGNDSIHLKAGDYIEVSKSVYHTKLVKLNDMNFFDVLRMKLTL